MSPEKRSAVMAKIRGKDTKPELAVRAMLLSAGLDFEEHVRALPGRPDFVIRDARLAIFVDGDFWHGRNFVDWRLKLSEKWEAKIAATIERDRRIRRELRRSGWRVIRLWEKQIAKDPRRCLRRIQAAVTRHLCSEGEPGNLAAAIRKARVDDDKGD